MFYPCMEYIKILSDIINIHILSLYIAIMYLKQP